MENTFTLYRPSQIVFAAQAIFCENFNFEAAKSLEKAINDHPDMLASSLCDINENLIISETYEYDTASSVYQKMEDILSSLEAYEDQLLEAMVACACEDEFPLDLSSFSFHYVEKYINTD